MTRFRRSIIWGAGITAILTLAAGTLVGWRLIEEEMCIRRLDSGDEGEREAAARRLGAMKSSRAVPKLVRLALNVPTQGPDFAGDALLAIGGAAVPPLLEEVGDIHSLRETAARSLLEKFGRDAAREFLAGARHRRKAVRVFSLSVLERYVNGTPGVHGTLVKALADPEWEVRLSAVRPLVKVPGRGVDVLRLLMGRLEDPHEEARVRFWAAFDMPDLGLPARAALRAALKHTDPLVRVYAAHSLLYKWPDLEQETAPVLLEGLQAPDWRARYQAIDSLSRLDSQSSARRLTARILNKLLQDPVQDVQSAALTALDGRDPTEEMVVPLIRILEEQPHQGPHVANVLARLGPRASPAVPALAEWIAKADEPGCAQVARALGRVGPAAAPSAPVLAVALKKGCCAALEALGRIGEGALEATPAILEALSGSDCRYEVRPALGRIGPKVIPYLLRALPGSETEVRRSVIQILGDFGPSAKAAAADVAAFVTDEEWEIKREAVRALGRVGPGAGAHVDAVLNALSAALARDDWDLAAVAAEALGRIGMPAGSSLERLVDAARSEGPEVRAHAMLALGRLERANPETIALLRGGLADEEQLVRSFSAMALGDLGIDDAHIAKALPAAFAGDGVYRLVRALEGFPEETKRVLPALLESLDAESPEYSIGVLKLIEGLGSDARAALPALLDLAGKARAETARPVGISISFDPTVKHYSAEDLVDAIEELRLHLVDSER